jgi:hypothetical protein
MEIFMSHPQSPINHLQAFAKRSLLFRCEPAGRKNAPERFVASIVHFLRSPPRPLEVSQLKAHLAESAASLQTFYVKHNGFVLYHDTLSSAAGIEALPVAAWSKETERLRTQIRERHGDDENPKGLLSCIVFATAPRSGNYFVIQTVGPDAGKIFYTDHETCSARTFATDFDDFVRRITADPIPLLAKELGCFARYADGSTLTQWIPEAVIESEQTVGTA